MIQFLKNAVFLWSLLVSFISGSIFYINEYSDFVTTHPVEVGIVALLLITWAATHFSFSSKVKTVEVKLDSGLHTLRVSILKAEVDRYYKCHKDSDSLSEDEGKYLYVLQKEMKELGVNSFTQRKVDSLLAKDIK
ncbi:hypothetical protein [Thiomicrorhabdus lithotrophica]|uniref:Uncharacterized protein n=1 Tax=Thiomicrorhabdus lithotrophica TaxID=2949997 RepID=A0ABY8C8C3_9GAMM|nr:hypothetical protein [Thiomicrorhabdus lithotrophica]WEJ62164.1 hypothetical protein NR989_09100 [Thiomicrorhabdus lithotrophica]